MKIANVKREREERMETIGTPPGETGEGRAASGLNRSHTGDTGTGIQEVKAPVMAESMIRIPTHYHPPPLASSSSPSPSAASSSSLSSSQHSSTSSSATSTSASARKLPSPPPSVSKASSRRKGNYTTDPPRLLEGSASVVDENLGQGYNQKLHLGYNYRNPSPKNSRRHANPLGYTIIDQAINAQVMSLRKEDAEEREAQGHIVQDRWKGKDGNRHHGSNGDDDDDDSNNFDDSDSDDDDYGASNDDSSHDDDENGGRKSRATRSRLRAKRRPSQTMRQSQGRSSWSRRRSTRRSAMKHQLLAEEIGEARGGDAEQEEEEEEIRDSNDKGGRGGGAYSSSASHPRHLLNKPQKPQSNSGNILSNRLAHGNSPKVNQLSPPVLTEEQSHPLFEAQKKALLEIRDRWIQQNLKSGPGSRTKEGGKGDVFSGLDAPGTPSPSPPPPPPPQVEVKGGGISAAGKEGLGEDEGAEEKKAGKRGRKRKVALPNTEMTPSNNDVTQLNKGNPLATDSKYPHCGTNANIDNGGSVNSNVPRHPSLPPPIPSAPLQHQPHLNPPLLSAPMLHPNQQQQQQEQQQEQQQPLSWATLATSLAAAAAAAATVAQESETKGGEYDRDKLAQTKLQLKALLQMADGFMTSDKANKLRGLAAEKRDEGS
eukprot:CAMPEP_0175058712 /NCGR_PEP_ID=MMETSP0052_2-20121109/12008_1 /TAXON_ID=51329 ORGANISM="Polytomella parva, Strain SAG 63-3" /NCGR_SAMPLE_ID=MMETSP0052_2 /ASSEMBLY_ACC=CAM_ASM_000194 /LENGTH=654 /DNA_ID=CAMNT_0016324139 /DNA_START=6 /DNA_END=1967 /DNA_ORIENTATION=+